MERGAATTLEIAMAAALARFAAEVGVSLSWLFTGDGQIGAPPSVDAATEAELLQALGKYAAERYAKTGRSIGVVATGREDVPRFGVQYHQPVRLVRPGFALVAPEDLPPDWRGRYVPLVGRLAAGRGIDTTEAEGHPAGFADAFVEFPGAPPRAFAVRIIGESMAPDYRDGDVLIVDGATSAKSGVCCVIQSTGGERLARIKSLRLAGQTAVLESINPQFQPIRVPAATIEAYEIMAHLPWRVEEKL